MPTMFWKMESKNVSGNGVAGRLSRDLTLFSLSCSLVEALMSFENRQKAKNNNENLDKASSSHADSWTGSGLGFPG